MSQTKGDRKKNNKKPPKKKGTTGTNAKQNKGKNKNSKNTKLKFDSNYIKDDDRLKKDGKTKAKSKKSKDSATNWKPTPKEKRKNVSNLTMNLFGMPHQFPPAVDPRVAAISQVVGKKFSENFLMETPFITLIPGRPSYMPKIKKNVDKRSLSMAVLEAQENNFKTLNTILKDMKGEDVKMYDFEPAYNEYMTYVNVLCRAGAAFLELTDTVNIGGQEYSFQRFDWRNYKWNTLASRSTVTRAMTALSMLGKRIVDKNYKKSAGKHGTSTSQKGLKVTDGSQFLLESWVDQKPETSVRELLKNYNYIQFYIDPDSGPSESLSNTAGSPGIKGALESGSNSVKDMYFMANAAGADEIAKTVASIPDQLTAMQGTINRLLNSDGNSGLAKAVNSFLNLGGATVKGHNLLIPDIYQNTSYTKSFQVTIHLKTPYANKLAWYLNVFVPWMHCVAFAAPAQETANSFSAPFLVKGFIDGIYSCNLGMVTSMSVQKKDGTFSIDGLPAEIDITMTIEDLYSDLMLSPSNDPFKFLANSSLIEFLCTSCGMSIIAPNQAAKWDNIVNTVTNKYLDIPGQIKAGANATIQSWVDAFFGLN